MIGVLSFFVILIVSILVTKVATIALAHTGMSHESARFQARSAFTGVGFTTNEAERVVTHPVRRRILMILMLLGNAGIVTAMTSLILSFVNPQTGTIPWQGRIVLIAGGVGILWTISSSSWFNRMLAALINWAFHRWVHLDTRDYVNLLHLGQGYRVKELQVHRGDWLAGKSLSDLKLTDEGVLILGVKRRDGRFLGAPTKETEIKGNDVLIMYGQHDVLEQLDERQSGFEGDWEHREAVSKQQAVIEQQEQEEEAAEAVQEAEAVKKEAAAAKEDAEAERKEQSS